MLRRTRATDVVLWSAIALFIVYVISSKYSSVEELLPEPQKAPVTVVSAYYEFPSKHTAEEYREWTNNFLQLGCHRILFCETHCERFRAFASDTLVVVEWPLALTDMAALQRMWLAQLDMDPELHLHQSHWLYIVWAQKAWFVKRAQELNPFNSTLFMWMDAGAFRDAARLPMLQHWPRADKAHALAAGDRIVALTVQPFPLQHTSGMVAADFIAGTSFLATEKGWDRFRLAYMQALTMAVFNCHFAGKDQTLFNNMFLMHPEYFHLIDSSQSPYDPWFYMQDLLA